MVPPSAWRDTFVPHPLGYRNALQFQIRAPQNVRTPAHRDTVSLNPLMPRSLGDTPPPPAPHIDSKGTATATMGHILALASDPLFSGGSQPPHACHNGQPLAQRDTSSGCPMIPCQWLSPEWRKTTGPRGQLFCRASGGTLWSFPDGWLSPNSAGSGTSQKKCPAFLVEAPCGTTRGHGSSSGASEGVTTGSQAPWDSSSPRPINLGPLAANHPPQKRPRWDSSFTKLVIPHLLRDTRSPHRL